MAHPSAHRCLRLRCPPSPSRSDHHRFLRPGALSRLRDSKIVARSLRSATRLLLPPPSSPPPRSPGPASSPVDGGVPHFFFGAARGDTRYPLRKRLAAARGVVSLPMPPGAPEAFLGAFVALASSDFVAAH